MILVSACLLGHHARYDGRHSLHDKLAGKLAHGQVLAVCPEMAGGLGVPRPAAGFENARVGIEGTDLLAGRARLVNADGRDVSQAFIDGARLVAARAAENGVKLAYLKDRSPSCGYDPQGRNPKAGVGLGVLAALLIELGIEVIEVRASASDDEVSPIGKVDGPSGI